MEELFVVRRGNFPLVLVALHGGALCPENMKIRTTGNILADMDTIPLLLRVDKIFKDKYPGYIPSILIVRLHRKYCDLNRDICTSYDRSDNTQNLMLDELWHSVYEWLKNEVEFWSNLCGQEWPLVFDIHGYINTTDIYQSPVYRGTYCGDSFKYVGNLDDVWNVPMFPATWNDNNEKSKYKGGFLVQYLKGFHGQVIQWEFPDWMRHDIHQINIWCVSLMESLDKWDIWIRMQNKLCLFVRN